jgi:hypothetical protein
MVVGSSNLLAWSVLEGREIAVVLLIAPFASSSQHEQVEENAVGGILAAFQGEIDVDADFKRSVDPEIHTQRGIRVTTKYLPLS